MKIPEILILSLFSNIHFTRYITVRRSGFVSMSVHNKNERISVYNISKARVI